MTHRRATVISCGSGKQRFSSLLEHLRSLRARFGVHDTDFSLSPPLLSHSCPPKASARWKESEWRHWKRAGTVRDRRRVDILSRSVSRTPDTPSFVCATGLRDGRKRLRWARDPLRKILTQAGHKPFLRLGELVKLRPLLYYIYLRLFMTLLCKIRQLLGRKVDKRRKMAFSLLALLKINF